MANMTSTQKDRCDFAVRYRRIKFIYATHFFRYIAQKETIFMKVYNDEANFQINPINVTIRLMFLRIGKAF